MDIVLGLLTMCAIIVVNVAGLYCFANFMEGLYNDHE